MNKHILEKLQIVSGVVPVNLATAANNGDWVSLKGYGRCAIVVFKGAGAAGEDPVITLTQATAVAGTGSKALPFTRVDSKVGTQTGIGTFTTTIQAAANTYTDLVSAENEGVFVIDVAASDLDVNNGFDCVQASIPDVGATAQIGGILYLLHEAKYEVSPMPSAIVD